ncbi:hypothetical protein GGF43_000706 [Coemansia sp. RSA 2618]|nr:hypothetical protein GGF43_000706 [Coemansia sp. RSA 2618]
MSGYGTATACPRIAESMAALVQQKVNEFYSHEQANAKGNKCADTLTPSVVIVLDRSVDLYSPLLREFTYQALVHDLIDLDCGNKYVYEAGSSGGQPQIVEAELSEQRDPIWKQLRHWHISDVSQTLADKFEKLLKDNIGVQAAKQV